MLKVLNLGSRFVNDNTKSIMQCNQCFLFIKLHAEWKGDWESAVTLKYKYHGNLGTGKQW